MAMNSVSFIAVVNYDEAILAQVESIQKEVSLLLRAVICIMPFSNCLIHINQSITPYYHKIINGKFVSAVLFTIVRHWVLLIVTVFICGIPQV